MGLSALAVLVLSATVLPGCSAHSKRKLKYRSRQDNLTNALDAQHPDQRRDAVARIAESRYVDSPEAFEVLDTVARTDPVPQIRCIAIRAFTAYDDDRPIRPLLTILQARPGSTDALPADADVRWETLNALITLTERVQVSDASRTLLRDILIELLETDTSRNVKIAATQALADFKDRPVLLPLIRTLRSEDFAIADSAEQSLIALTGVTHHYDPDAWETWVATTDAPFANAGQVPVTTRPEGPTWFDKQKRAWRRALKLQTD